MKIMLIPDTQVKPGVPLEHLEWAGNYLVDKRPDVVVMIGDFADMPSLSSYDVGKKSFEGRRYKDDIDSAHEGMALLLGPLQKYNNQRRRNGKKQYRPRQVMCLGNHEDRINRAVEDDAKLDGVLSIDDLRYRELGWEVIPFLQPEIIGGIAFSHYFPSGVLGRPVTSARMLLTKKHMSCVAGHLQGRDIAYSTRADGTSMMGLIAGSFYLHDEDYLSYQTNRHWRGIYMLHEVNDGACDEMAVSVNYLGSNYA